jgi:hypothetical protein
MYIACYNCGGKQWFDTRRTCEICGATLRRCADCTHYSKGDEKCKLTGGEIERAEAEKPTALAVSALCQQYSPHASVMRSAP